MAKDKKKTDDEGTEEAKSGKLKLIIGAVVLVVVGAVLGGKVLGGGSAPAAAGPTTTTTEPPGLVSTLDPITLNLADGRFLKLGLAFEVRLDEEYPSADAIAADSVTKGFAREVDLAITTVGAFTYEQLIAPDGKDLVKDQLMGQLAEISEDAIKNVYFTEFVMQ